VGKVYEELTGKKLAALINAGGGAKLHARAHGFA
jgi:hypothetical protein